MINGAKRDSRFGAITAGTFGKQLDWANVAELRCPDFHCAGNRIVRIYQAVIRQKMSLRCAIFFDPDTGQWTNWE